MKASELTITFRAKDTGEIRQHVCLSGAEMRRMKGQLKRAGRLVTKCCETCRHFVHGSWDQQTSWGWAQGDPDLCEHPKSWIASFNFRFPFEKGCKNWESAS